MLVGKLSKGSARQLKVGTNVMLGFGRIGILEVAPGVTAWAGIALERPEGIDLTVKSFLHDGWPVMFEQQRSGVEDVGECTLYGNVAIVDGIFLDALHLRSDVLE